MKGLCGYIRHLSVVQTISALVPHQLYKIICHAFVILVHSMHHSVNKRLLIALTQLRNIAKVHIGNSAISQRKDIARMGVAVKESKLQTQRTAPKYRR